ncbi:MAG: hypothetical protein ABSB91_07045 [Sedimentisphaerales bacterium]
MINLYLGCCFGLWKDIFQLSANLATVIGVIVALFVAGCALKTYRRNNSIKRWELIEKLYGAFIKDNWYEFYERIKNGGKIDLSKDIKLLNETLTLFDALNYFRTQRLIDKKAWEYVACEILNFALNDTVWEYMKNIKKPYVEKGFPEDIIPFTGFPELFDKLPKKFKKKCLSQLEKRFNELSPEDQSSYYNKAKNITDERLQLKRAVAFCIYDNAQKGRKANTQGADT